MRNILTTGLGLTALAALAACQSAQPAADYGRPAPIAAAPSGVVQSSQLPPPPPPPPPVEAQAALPPAAPPTSDPAAAGAAAAPGASAPTQTASAQPVKREGLVGAWKVSAGGGSCQIFMALTKWTGGYRAASRGCPGQVADVTAWDVSGSQVVLKDSNGGTVASLNSSGGTRYEGSTSGGQQISLYR